MTKSLKTMSLLELSNGFLPNDLVCEILARLPIKSLFKFRSVCKLWCRLPFEKHFINLHYQLSSGNTTLLAEIVNTLRMRSTYVCVDRFSGALDFSMDFLKDRVKIRASCNGLLCCASVPNRGVYYVCNPMTRKFRMLPRSRARPFTRCQPEYEATLVGLAVDPMTLKFNVVLAGLFRPFGRRPLDLLVCLIFDSETDSWRRFVTSQYDEFTLMNRNQVVFANGFLHWLTHRCTYVLVLDLQDDVWMKVTLPSEIRTGGLGSRVYLLELEKEVSVIHMSEMWMNIWVLKDYVKEQWLLVDRVNLRCIRGIVANAFPISQTRDVIFLAAQKKVVTYSPKNKVWKEVYVLKESCTYPIWFSAHAYRSTLFPCN